MTPPEWVQLGLRVLLVGVFAFMGVTHFETFGRAAIPFWPRYLGQLALIALVLAAAVRMART